MEEATRDSRRKSGGEISDQHAPQDQRKAVQKRIFTRWMNVVLQRCDPPVEVRDLFADIQDGRVLMALLEQLSGCKLLYRFRPPSHHIFKLNNISKALAFLDDRHVKLLGIDASGIADGSPSAVLNLVWNIILHFQVKEGTRGLQRHLSSSLSSLSMSSYPSAGDLPPQLSAAAANYSCYTLPSKGKKAARDSKYHGKAIKTLLRWVQRCTSKFGVEVHDFGKSWRSGLAFLAVIKSIDPGLVDLRASWSGQPRDNVEQAFAIAHHSLGIAPLLEPEDVTCPSPDEQSIITYVSMFPCPDVNEDYSPAFAHRGFPRFGSLDSLTLGGTTAWRRWSRTSSFQTNGSYAADVCSSYDDVFSPCYSRSPCFSPFNTNEGLQPPSVLDRAKQDGPLWLDQRWGGEKAAEFSLSSEEGADSLSALDSDEEDAYTYILDLNKEVFIPHNPLKRQVAKVEEETAEELNQELEQPDASEVVNGNGCKQQEDVDVNSGVEAYSDFHRKLVVDRKESSFRDVTDTGVIFDLEPDDEPGNGKESPEDENEAEKTGRVGVVTYGHDERAARVDEAEKTKMVKVCSWQKEAEEDSNKWLVNEKMAGDGKEETHLTCDEGKSIKLDPKEEKNNRTAADGEVVQIDTLGPGANESVYEVSTAGVHMGGDGDRAQSVDDSTRNSRSDDTEFRSSEDSHTALMAFKKPDSELKSRKCKLTETAIIRPGDITLKNEADAGGDHGPWASPCETSSHSLSEGRLRLQSLAAFGDVTPSELETLLVSWILLYCCLILSQLSL